MWYWINRIILRNKIVTKMILGNKMKLDISDRGACVDLFLDGIREIDATNYFRGIMQKDWTVLDIGAHIGYYALQEAGMVNKVYAIEPCGDTVELLKQNIELNNVHNVYVKQIAIGGKKGNIQFKMTNYTNLRRVSPCNDLFDSTSIPVDTIDNLFSGEKVDYLRMDVEGYTLNILRGAEKTIADNNIGLFIEVHRDLMKEYGYTLADLLRWLDDHGIVIEKTIFRPTLKGFGYSGLPNNFLNDSVVSKIIDGYYASIFWLFLRKVKCQ
jgi:FkbM family methyltransferase